LGEEGVEESVWNYGKITGYCIKWHSMELHHICLSSDIIKINKSGIMTQVAQVICAEEMRKSYRVSVEKN